MMRILTMASAIQLTVTDPQNLFVFPDAIIADLNPTPHLISSFFLESQIDEIETLIGAPISSKPKR